MTLVASIRRLLERLRRRGEANLEREVVAADDRRRREPEVVDASEGVPPVPIDSGAGGISF